MTLGKAISLFLIDADPTGRIIAELHNWTGKLYKIPRRLLGESAQRLFRAGVYFLFGRDETDPERPFVYVGEAEEVYKRLLQHQAKDFWNDAVVCISKDDNLNKAHIKFLEHELYKALIEAGRAKLQNGNVPPQPAISEFERAVMTEFLQNLKLLVGTLGYRVFEPVVKAEKKAARSETFFIRGARGADAQAIVTNEGVVVLEGSRAASTTAPSTPAWALAIRTRLVETGVIDTTDDQWRFTKDHVFSSPSAAAATVLGRSSNGLVEWKDQHGLTLKEKLAEFKAD